MATNRELVAQALPAYEIGAELGRGAFGVVLAARHRELDRDAAVKQLSREVGADPLVRRRFAAEARLLASLDHPHIVPIHDYVEHDGLCLLVMERLGGGTLADWMARKPLSPQSACAAVLASCAALHYAHEHGVLHRDIKPDNLMFSRESVLKVTDFGIAKVVGGATTMATRTGDVLGTPAYIAPEQVTGGDLTPATDVYAIAMVLYELLAGRLPYPQTDTVIAALYRHVNEDAPPVLSLDCDVAPALAAIADQGLRRDPAQRFTSASLMGAALSDAAVSTWGPQWADEGDVRLRIAPSTGSRPPGSLAPRDPVDLGTALTLDAEVAPVVDAQVVPVRATFVRLRRYRTHAKALAVVAAILIAAVALAYVMTRRHVGPGSRLVYADALADPAGGWTRVDLAESSADYIDGRYRLVVKHDAPWLVKSDSQLEGAAFRRDLTVLRDTSVEVSATPVLGTPAGFFGLLCRETEDGSSFYAAFVGGDGRWGIFKYQSGTPTALTTGQTPVSPSATVRLRFTCTGAGVGQPANLDLSEIGVRLAEATDRDGLGPGRVGVAVSAIDKSGVAVDFDHLVVRTAAART